MRSLPEQMADCAGRDRHAEELLLTSIEDAKVTVLNGVLAGLEAAEAMSS